MRAYRSTIDSLPPTLIRASARKLGFRWEAVIVTTPAATARTTPASSTVAIAGSEERQEKAYSSVPTQLPP